ncbi:hypothetical protein [Robertkochia sediminum]|uniref:hypothetical protein n=1 Tax=Robertkochia sediminum TaxID=2785326 RepID=UPI001933CF5E|nr:hypothetical protein [Robertkochia sediminum]MBL7473318.1 hypothetical protein [Robertkochia sediminum]
MRKTILHIILLIPLISFSQDWEIPEINWIDKTEKQNIYIELLNLKDSNSLIVRIGHSSYWTKGMISKFLVYQNNGKVTRYDVFQPSDPKDKTDITRRKIRKQDYKFYWSYLNECSNNDLFEIDRSRLNITKKPNKDAGRVLEMNAVDGTNYHFEICQGNNYIAYGTYAPESYIKEKYPGWKERQKLLNLMEGFEQLIKTY